MPEVPFQLSLLGHFRLMGPDGPIDLGNKKLCALLAFICATPEPPSRVTIMALLWGSHFEARAQHNLRQALTRLRQALGNDAFVNIDNAIGLKPGLIRCDATSFETLIHADSHGTRKAAIDLYRGPFLANIVVSGGAWNDWVSARRQRLENLAVAGLIRLGEEEEKLGAPLLALEYAQQAVALNDLREDGHRLIIRSLAMAGRRTEAHEHYNQLASRLMCDLNVEPDATTTALVANDCMQTPASSALVFRSPPLHGILPSIAVLPFRNLGDDPGDDYFADGIVEDIVISLAGLRELLVISRNSTLAFRSHTVDARMVGRTLGVRYVVEGSVRKSKTAIRISSQLCDTETGVSLWAEQQELPLDDLFEVQDHLVHNIVAGIVPNVRTAELARALRTRPTCFTAYDHMLQALNLIHSPDRQVFRSARDHLDNAMAAHSGFAMPVAWLAFWHLIWIGQSWSNDPKNDADAAAAFAARATNLDPYNALALATQGHVRSFLFHDYESAQVHLDRALAASPNSSVAWVFSSATMSYIGRSSDAVRYAERGLRLSPYDPNRFLHYAQLSVAHYSHGNYADAAKWGHLSIASNPAFTATFRYLAAALAADNRLDEARDVASKLLELEPGFRLGLYERTRQPFRHAATKALYMEHLRKAGLPA